MVLIIAAHEKREKPCHKKKAFKEDGRAVLRESSLETCAKLPPGRQKIHEDQRYADHGHIGERASALGVLFQEEIQNDAGESQPDQRDLGFKKRPLDVENHRAS